MNIIVIKWQVNNILKFTIGNVCSRMHLREDSPCGTTVVKIAAAESAMEDNQDFIFSIYDGNIGGAFQVMRYYLVLQL